MKYIVVRTAADGSTLSERRPRSYPRPGDAIREAERLAILYPGREFVVMMTFGSRKVEKEEKNVTVFD